MLASASAYAGPGYRYTSGHKIRFWSDLPTQDNIVSWSGARDPEGYATGLGTLTFYRENWKWTIGSNIPHGKPIPVNSYTGTMVKGKFNGMVSLATPGGGYSHVKYADGTPTGKWVDGPAPEAKSKKLVAEKAAAPAATEAKPNPEAPAEGPSLSIATPKPGQATDDGSVDIVKEKADAGSDSLRSLIAPPSALPKTNSKLSRAEAIRSADEQAIAAGFNVGDYRNRKVRFDAPAARWTVSYEQPVNSDASDSSHPKHFTVTVDDTSGQAAIAPGN